MSVAIFGLLASIGWGFADFGGGLASRRAAVVGVLFGSQFVSLLVAIPIVALAHEPSMGARDLAIALGAGALGASGLALLYRGLSVGRMGVVAPIAAVLTATLPVLFGFATQGAPSTVAIVGIAFAIASVVLVSRSPASADGRSSGLWYGLAAGAIFGTFTIAVAQLSDEVVLSPTLLIRVGSVSAIGAWILVRRPPWRVPRGMWPALLAIGLVDMAATAVYLTAIQIGPLAIAAILASLYPVATTVLAAVVLSERVRAVQAAGIVAALVAVALIAGSSPG
ncbi:MAG: DMT family transporter [Chloroflexi bacterium]|nr:DMT family transporter [Chloroflexota bacterium]